MSPLKKMNQIEAQNLTKYYGDFPALQEVNFKVEKGEIVGFLGPNGAGKTTTMRILTGFLPPSSGTVRVAGFDTQTQSIEARRRTGYLPESVPLYKELTGTSFLQFLATIRGVIGSRREERIKEVIHICRLDEYSKSLISKLSKGYRQLVGIAQAILHEPEVLILDEPTIGIDPRQVVHIRQLIKEFGQKHTVILSSHILPEVSQVCGRVMVMDQGRIVAVDRPENMAAGFGGPQCYEIEAGGSEEKILALLQKVEGVLKVRIEGTGKTRCYLVESQPGRDIRDDLSSALMKGGVHLLGLKSRDVSLEDIFLRLTTREKE
jgi:ABC-2 type transport system ATP-binding protein